MKKVKKFFSNQGTRNEVRERVVSYFLKEEPGTGKGSNSSKYLYCVEELIDGKKVYLQRPASLKFGFDFLINIENQIFPKDHNRNPNAPRHDHLYNDLLAKQTENAEKYLLLYKSIEKVYNCNEITNEMINLSFRTGYSVELLLKTIKWFFIEQDIRYWNYSGRAMFMSGIPKPITNNS